MIINILTEKDFLDLLYGDWTYTDEAKKALYRYYNNTESNFIFNSTQILSEWEEYETMDLAIEANQFTLEDRDFIQCVESYEDFTQLTTVLEDYGRGDYVLVKEF
jgi:predicted ATPase